MGTKLFDYSSQRDFDKVTLAIKFVLTMIMAGVFIVSLGSYPYHSIPAYIVTTAYYISSLSSLLLALPKHSHNGFPYYARSLSVLILLIINMIFANDNYKCFANEHFKHDFYGRVYFVLSFVSVVFNIVFIYEFYGYVLRKQANDESNE